MGKLKDDMLYREIFISSKSDGGGGGITPSGVKAITENGMHDVTRYASVNVDVPIPDGYVYPYGGIDIQENGVHYVAGVAEAHVNVPIPDGYVYPNGTVYVYKNGTHDVSSYASVNVDVLAPDGWVSPKSYKQDIEQVAQFITDLSGMFDGATEEGAYPYYILTLPGFSTINVKDFTNAFANWGPNLTTIPCTLKFTRNTTENGIFTNSKYIQNLTVAERSIYRSISFVPIKALTNASLLSILRGLNFMDHAVRTLRLPSTCFNGQTESVITGDAELNAAYQDALNAGWTITFNLVE